MDSSFFLTVVVAEIGFLVLFGTIGFLELLSALFFMVLRKYGFRPENIDLPSSSSSSPPSYLHSSPSSSPSSSLPSSSSPPSSLCSSIPPSSKWTHDVFPSFRGEDVRTNFFSHFKKEFRRKGITPFIDNGIKRGESIGPELIQAIRRSKIAIVLVSKNYATSKWCLNELVEIMKCKKELNQSVFPIFYGVPPSDVKKLTGGFGELFEKTCAGQKKEDTQRWRQAFAEMATIAGYDSSNWDNEAVMIEEIVTEISKTLISSTPSRYMEDLIGVQAHIEKMKSLLCLGSSEVRTVGIWGPCGIGKTTIARVLHEQVSDVFQQSVFMTFKPSYARSTCSDDHDEKLHLEQEFLSQLTNQGHIKFSQWGAAQNFVMHKKLLVIFDGVEKLVQLLAMPKARYFGPGSRIIITTQNLKLLNAFEVEHIYQVNLPPANEALQIFCMSAFGQKSPKDGFKYLAWEVTNLAGRLPLGLRIMGSHLHGMSKEEWKEELPRLRIRLDGDIGSILKLSYDALCEEDKDLFLYIACFFIEEGLDVDIFEDVLRHRFSNVRQGLKVLVQRSLVSMPIDMFYDMHNLIVQLGREIVRSQSIHEPGKRQFLVDAKEICEVLTENTGSTNITGINLNISEMKDDLCISERAFENMSNLQLLRFDCGAVQYRKLELPQGLQCLPSNLRILSWRYYPMKCLPSYLNTEFLVKIEMKNSKLEILWKGIQPLGNLKLMKLDHSKNLKELPDLSTATNLKRMDLTDCSSLMELPSSITNLITLQTLNLRGCSSLLQLPSSIGNLTNIQNLGLDGCSSLLQLPSSIGNLTNIQILDLTLCSSLLKLPSSIGNLTNLQTLDLTLCSSLLKLPSSIGNLTDIQTLDLRGCSSLLKLPSSIGNLTNLQTLKPVGCSNLVELPSSIGNLTNIQTLDLNYLEKGNQGCSIIQKLPSFIGNLTNLRWLNLRGCSNLVELFSSICDLTKLLSLDIGGCSNIVELPSSIGNLTNLTKLDLSDCSRLVKIPSSIGELQMLKKLDLHRCSSLVKIPSSIGKLQKLEELDLRRCSSLVKIPSSIGELQMLKKLDLQRCSSLVKIPSSIGKLQMLTKLDLQRCSSLVKIPSSIGELQMLTKLDLQRCSSLVKIPSSIGKLQMLTELDLQRCSKLEVLPININLGSLEEIDVTDCSQLRSFPEISTNIKKLTLGGTLIKEVPLAIKSWSKLEKFSVTYCKDLEKSPHAFDFITELEFNNIEMEELPSWISGISRLHRLVLNNCRKLVSLPQLPGSLRSLHAENCDSLESLACSFPERLACSFPNPNFHLKFINCWKLNEEARDIIIQTSSMFKAAILPGREVPAFFTHRATTTGGSLTIKLDRRCFPTFLRFKACILLANKSDKGARDEDHMYASYKIVNKQGGRDAILESFGASLQPLLTEHLYTFEVNAKNVKSGELLFEFKLDNEKWEIAECGIRELY